MSEQRTVTYRGPAPFASALAQMLREEGVNVNYTPPPEERSGTGALVGAVVVNLLCAGAYDAIKAGVRKFRSSRFGSAAEVEFPDEDSPRGDGA